MGKFFITKTWLEDRENEIPIEKRWILLDLEIKGFINSFNVDGIKYYTNSSGYLQHFK